MKGLLAILMALACAPAWGVTVQERTTIATLGLSGMATATTSADVAGAISNETGTGALVLGTAPTIVNANLTGDALANDLTVEGNFVLPGTGPGSLLKINNDIAGLVDTATPGTDFVKPSPVIRFDASTGDMVPGVVADVTNAAEVGAAMLAAKNAASAGDMIYVTNDADVTGLGSMAKDGVDWHFGDVVVTSTSVTGWVFDASEAMTFAVTGSANFVRTANGGTSETLMAAGVCRTNHASADVTFECRTARFESDVASVDINAVFANQLGRMSLTADKVVLDSDADSFQQWAIWWEDGEFNGYVRELIATGVESWCIGGECTSHDNDFRLHCERIDGTYAVKMASSDPLAAMWVDAKTIKNLCECGSGKLYLTAQKFFGEICINGGELYVDAQKVGGDILPGRGSQPLISLDGGVSELRISRFDPGNGVLQLIDVSAGAHTIHAGNLDAQTAQDAVRVGGGTLNILTGVVSSDVGELDLLHTGGTLNVSAGVKYDASKTSGTITALPAWGVTPSATTLGALDENAAGWRTAISAQESDADLADLADGSLTGSKVGNLPVTSLNSGTGASSSTYWRGDGTWATPAGGLASTDIDTSAELRAILGDEVGTGAAYFVGGALQTPASGNAANLTGLPVSTGISGLGTGVATALAANANATGGVLLQGAAAATFTSLTLTGSPGVTGFGSTSDHVMWLISAGTQLEYVSGFRFRVTGTPSVSMTSGGVCLSSGSALAWGSGDAGVGLDTFLRRDAANVIAQRNGTTAQAYRLYRTYTDSSNYERGALMAVAGGIELAAETAGTGADNPNVYLTPAGSGSVVLTKTVTAGGTTGNQTINKQCGTVNIASGQTSVTVTNSLVTTSSVVICTIATNTTDFSPLEIVQASGSFTIHLSQATSAETRVNFLVFN